MNITSQFITFLVCILLNNVHISYALEKEPAALRRETSHIITLIVKPYEYLAYDPSYTGDTQKHDENFNNVFKWHQALMQTYFEPHTDPQGVYVLYGGFVDVLDFNHQVRFPRLTQEDEVVLIITRKIHPIILRGNTVEFFVRDSTQAIAYYKFKRHFDQTNSMYYWNVEKLAIPENPNTPIPASAMIIFAHPNHIFVPLEDTIAVPGGNLVLPALYATEKLKKDYNALTFLDVSPYFDPIKYVTKIAPPQRYAQKIGNL